MLYRILIYGGILFAASAYAWALHSLWTLAYNGTLTTMNF